MNHTCGTRRKPETCDSSPLEDALALAGLLSCAPAMAGSIYDVTVQQVGDNVVFTGTGSVNLTGLMSSQMESGGVSGSVVAFTSFFSIGAGNSYDVYSGLSGPGGHDSFATGNSIANANAGQYFGVEGDDGYLYLPGGYVSDTDLGTSTSTYDNTTIAGLGLIPGTYDWTWADGDITLTIPSVPVPEPATLALLGLPLAILLLARRGRPMSR